VNDEPEPLRVQIGRRAVAVAKGIALAPLAVFGVLFIVMFPGGVAILIVDWAFSTGVVAIETAVVTVLMVSTFAGLWWAFAYGGIASLLPFGRFEPTVRASVLAFFAVVSFTSLTGLLYEEGLIEISERPERDQGILDLALEFHVWQLANTLPLVDIPGNLDWNKPFEFEDRLGGLLVIVFTGFVIFPLIQAARLILAGGQVPFEVTVVRVLRKAVGERRIFTVRRREGYGRALVDQRLLVDVMTRVWNHDAALRRLERIGTRPADHRPAAYLLVVDAIADRARDRIERELDEAPFPARLAVWRADQPEQDLIAAFEALEEALGRTTRSAPAADRPG
jgi:hypothetical protein